MKPIEELRAAHAATTREGWGAEWKVGTKYQRNVVTAEYAGTGALYTELDNED